MPGGPVSPPTAEVNAAVEQAAGSAPVEQVETTDVASAASEVEVPTEPSEVVTEVEDVASTSPSPTPQVKHIASSVPSPDETTRSAHVNVPVDLPSGDEPAPVDPDPLTDHVRGKTRESLDPKRHMAALVDEARRSSTATIRAADRLVPPRGELDLLSGLPMPTVSPETEERQSSAATQVVTKTTSDRPTPFSNLERRSDLLPGPIAVGPRLRLGEYLTAASSLDTGRVNAPALHHGAISLSPRTEIVETVITGHGDRGRGNSAPPDLPPLVPQSPAIAVGDAGGASSVPVVALLALLALAAPAARRRLGEVAAFRPPTPFVCALERPG